MSIRKDLESRNALFRDLENGMRKAPDQGQAQGSASPSKGGSVLDLALDRTANKGQEMTGQAAEFPSKGGSVLDRALDRIASKGQEMTGQSQSPGLTSGPRDHGIEM